MLMNIDAFLHTLGRNLPLSILTLRRAVSRRSAPPVGNRRATRIAPPQPVWESMKIILSEGSPFPAIATKNIHGVLVSVPDPNGKLTHLQFRRFAGCPICNLHLQNFIKRHSEMEQAGIKEVVVFHSGDNELLPSQGRFPFDVVGDPTKQLYRRYGVESSIWAILSPGAWQRAAKANMEKDKPVQKGFPTGGVLGLPADFLIGPDGVVKAAHYGKHADDQWTVDEVLEQAKSLPLYLGG